MSYHTHYDERQDKRWVCRRDPCLWHDVVPEPDVAPPPSVVELSIEDLFQRLCAMAERAASTERRLAQAWASLRWHGCLSVQPTDVPCECGAPVERLPATAPTPNP